MNKIPHEICEGCRWNNYPVCRGTIMSDGNPMNIENLKAGFRCGQKESEETTSFVKIDEVQAKINELENRIIELESKITAEKL